MEGFLPTFFYSINVFILVAYKMQTLLLKEESKPLFSCFTLGFWTTGGVSETRTVLHNMMDVRTDKGKLNTSSVRGGGIQNCNLHPYGMTKRAVCLHAA